MSEHLWPLICAIHILFFFRWFILRQYLSCQRVKKKKNNNEYFSLLNISFIFHHSSDYMILQICEMALVLCISNENNQFVFCSGRWMCSLSMKIRKINVDKETFWSIDIKKQNTCEAFTSLWKRKKNFSYKFVWKFFSLWSSATTINKCLPWGKLSL